MPSFFGSGFAQGFGASMADLPRLILASRQQERQRLADELLLKKMDLDNKGLKLRASEFDLKKKRFEAESEIQQMLSEEIEEELTQSAIQPDPEVSGFAESQGLPGQLFPEIAAQERNQATQGALGRMQGRLPAGASYQMGSLTLRGQGPPDAFRTAAAQVTSLGVPENHPRHKELTGKLLIAQSAPGMEGKVLLQDVMSAAQSLSQGGEQGDMPVLGGDMIGRATSAYAERAGAQARARGEADLETRPVPEGAKLDPLLDTQRSVDFIGETYDPRFVGKGFQEASKLVDARFSEQAALARQGKYVPGALFGSVREFFGNISTEEAGFRSAVLDVQDQLLRLRSGAQINEQEFQRLAKIAPKLLDEPPVFEAKLNRFKKALQGTLRDRLKRSSTSAKGLLMELDEPLEIKKRKPRSGSLVVPEGWNLEVE